MVKLLLVFCCLAAGCAIWTDANPFFFNIQKSFVAQPSPQPTQASTRTTVTQSTDFGLGGLFSKWLAISQIFVDKIAPTTRRPTPTQRPVIQVDPVYKPVELENTTTTEVPAELIDESSTTRRTTTTSSYETTTRRTTAFNFETTTPYNFETSTTDRTTSTTDRTTSTTPYNFETSTTDRTTSTTDRTTSTTPYNFETSTTDRTTSTTPYNFETSTTDRTTSSNFETTPSTTTPYNFETTPSTTTSYNFETSTTDRTTSGHFESTTPSTTEAFTFASTTEGAIKPTTYRPSTVTRPTTTTESGMESENEIDSGEEDNTNEIVQPSTTSTTTEATEIEPSTQDPGPGPGPKPYVYPQPIVKGISVEAAAEGRSSSGGDTIPADVIRDVFGSAVAGHSDDELTVKTRIGLDTGSSSNGSGGMLEDSDTGSVFGGAGIDPRVFYYYY